MENDMSNLVETINNKIRKRDEDFRIYTYDNGYLIEVGGRNDEDDWVTAKVFAQTIAEVQEAVEHILTNIPVNA
jgi:hypothetical protein